MHQAQTDIPSGVGVKIQVEQEATGVLLGEIRQQFFDRKYFRLAPLLGSLVATIEIVPHGCAPTPHAVRQHHFKKSLRECRDFTLFNVGDQHCSIRSLIVCNFPDILYMGEARLKIGSSKFLPTHKFNAKNRK